MTPRMGNPTIWLSVVDKLPFRAMEPVLKILGKNNDVFFIHNMLNYPRFYLKPEHRLVRSGPELGLLSRAFGKVKLAHQFLQIAQRYRVDIVIISRNNVPL